MDNFDFDVVTSNVQSVGIGTDAKAKLQKNIEIIEKLEEQKANIVEDIRCVFTVLKAEGFDLKTVRQVLRLRKKEKEEREEELNTLDTYLHALGMI